MPFERPLTGTNSAVATLHAVLQLLDEDSFVAMHNRMLQLCLPTAVDAVSPDAAIMLLHALGVRIFPRSSQEPAAQLPSPAAASLRASMPAVTVCSMVYCYVFPY
jgi:hypothetical protein